VIREIEVEVSGPGLHEITAPVDAAVRAFRDASGAQEGLCTLFLRHTSASLLVQENADPSARRDLEAWLARLVPEDDPLYTHTLEGPDDMPAHIKAALTATSLGIPFQEGRLLLGSWQGIFLWEHRSGAGPRRVVAHFTES